MARRAIQLYTLREMDVPFTDLLEMVADAGFEGVEYAYRVPEADPAEVRATLAETGLEVPSAHVPIEEMEEDLAATVERYRDLEAERLVVPAVDEEHFESVDAVEALADRLDGLAADLAEHDFPLLYHSHHFEFTDLEGTSGYERLVEATETVDFELDVGLARYAGADPAALVEQYGGRIDLLHCTDTDLDFEEMAHARFGTGPVDYEAVFDAAEAAGIEWYIYENGSQDDPEAELEYAREAFL
ncbi:MAG: sugar phosphate isomerase/epimerase family protein [Haloarculaceae archaeon]